jgi:hypothetical protein
MPTYPFAKTVRIEEVALPDALVVDAMSKSLPCEPYVPWSESLAKGVPVPTERFLFVLSKKNFVASEVKPEAPFENWMAPEIPEED